MRHSENQSKCWVICKNPWFYGVDTLKVAWIDDLSVISRVLID